MDPLAHTLVGASLAETGLRYKTRFATATLIIAANLPDIDGVCSLAGQDSSLAGRRGITHGVLALLVLPVVLAGVMYLLAKRGVQKQKQHAAQRAVAAEQSPAGLKKHALAGSEPVSFRWLLALASVGVLTHPLLDWMNSYGVRWLMPFSSTWFYGDALFIVEPAVWLLGAAAVVFARGHTKLAAAGWILLLLATTAVIVMPSLTPPPAKLWWCVGAGLLVFLRVRTTSPPPRATAIVCLSALAVYVCVMLVGTGRARARVQTWFEGQSLSPDLVVATPLPGRPMYREAIAQVAGQYHFLEVAIWGEDAPRVTERPLALGQRTPAVVAALAAPEVQGFVEWMRLPAFKQEEMQYGTRVTLIDARYARHQPARMGWVQVDLDHERRVIRTRP